ncbi:MAG TPA: hypothetical protein VMY77_17505, partial [Chitinophagaceae bacterium]|nr:hypothetical protein [Chitinophagaceae bacterium]
MKKLFVLLLLFLASHCFSQPRDTLFYSVVNLGKVTGENKVWKTSPNEYQYYYYFNDRGRGAVINATVYTSPDGKIQKAVSSGLDYYKVPFSSSFQKQNDSLVWQYKNKRSAERDTGQTYVFYGVPAGIDIFIKDLLKAPRHALITAGGDTAFLGKPLIYNFALNGKRVQLFLYEIKYGINSIPDYTWLDADNNFFGNIGGWSAVIKKGYEKLVDTLYALQGTKVLPYLKIINKKLTDKLSKRFAITNVTLFDAPKAKAIVNQTVLVEDGIIKAVGNAAALKIPEHYTIINGIGKTLLPGLWDTHSHYQKNHGSFFLSGGVTHVRDMGNMPYIRQLQQSIRQHDLIGPDISYLSGFIDKDD